MTLSLTMTHLKYQMPDSPPILVSSQTIQGYSMGVVPWPPTILLSSLFTPHLEQTGKMAFIMFQLLF